MPKPPKVEIVKYVPPTDTNKDAGWPPTWQLLRDTTRLCRRLSFDFSSDLDAEPYSVSVLASDSYMSFKGQTPTHALRKLAQVLLAQVALKKLGVPKP
jgi:hypothetical protein